MFLGAEDLVHVKLDIPAREEQWAKKVLSPTQLLPAKIRVYEMPAPETTERKISAEIEATLVGLSPKEKLIAKYQAGLISATEFQKQLPVAEAQEHTVAPTSIQKAGFLGLSTMDLVLYGIAGILAFKLIK